MNKNPFNPTLVEENYIIRGPYVASIQMNDAEGPFWGPQMVLKMAAWTLLPSSSSPPCGLCHNNNCGTATHY